MRRSSITLALLAVLVAAPIAALAEGADSGPPTGAQPSPTTNPGLDPAALFGKSDLITATLGAGQLDGDYYIQSRGLLDFDLGTIGFGLQLPINLLVYSANEPPTRDDKTYFHVLRKADYPALTADTWGHYLSLVRYFRVGQKRDPIYFYYGQMFGSTIGHGTIVDRYNNTLDLTKPRSGIAFDVNSDYGGFETLINDIAWPSTNIAAARAYVKPLGTSGKPILEKWSIGLSVATDRNAPRLLQTSTTDAAGQPCNPSCTAVGRDGLPIAAEATPFNIFGIDTEIEVLRNDVIMLIPYVDWNFQPRGSGIHLGALANFRLPIFGAVKLWSRAELRIMQAGYIPGYFDAAYDQQRFTFPINNWHGPKATASYELVPLGAPAPIHAGYFAEASAELLGLVRGGATFSQTIGIPNSSNLMVFATLPRFDTIKVSAYYLRKNFAGIDDIFTLDERSVLTGSAYYQIYGPLYVGAQFNRAWRTDPVTGQIVGVNDWNVGLQAFMPL